MGNIISEERAMTPEARQLLRFMVQEWLRRSPCGKEVMLATGYGLESATDHVLELMDNGLLVVEADRDVPDLDIDGGFSFTIRPASGEG